MRAERLAKGDLPFQGKMGLYIAIFKEDYEA